MMCFIQSQSLLGNVLLFLSFSPLNLTFEMLLIVGEAPEIAGS